VARGYQEPFAIRRWYVGNELCAFGRGGVNDPERAAEASAAFAAAMKAVDPSIELIPSCWALSDWNQSFLGALRRLGADKLFSMASYHQYLLDVLPDAGPLVPGGPLDPASGDAWSRCLRAPTDLILPRMRAAREELNSAGGAFREMPLSMDEWNYYWGRPGHPAMALYMAGMFQVAMRYADELKLDQALYFHPINEGLIRAGDGEAHLEDGGLIWRMYRRYAGLRRVDAPDSDPSGALDVLCAEGEGGWYLTAVNRDGVEPHALPLPPGTRESVECYACLADEDRFTPSRLMRVHPDAVEGGLMLPPASVAAVFVRRSPL
jgi:hypothetical protein